MFGMQAGGEARLQGPLPAPLLPLHSYSPVHQAVPRADQKGKQAYRTLFRWATGYLHFLLFMGADFVSEHSEQQCCGSGSGSISSGSGSRSKVL